MMLEAHVYEVTFVLAERDIAEPVATRQLLAHCFAEAVQLAEQIKDEVRPRSATHRNCVVRDIRLVSPYVVYRWQRELGQYRRRRPATQYRRRRSMSDSLRGYDAWKTTEPTDRRDSKGPIYYCRDCRWRGNALHAYDHHRKTDHHRLVVRGLRAERAEYPAVFSCCADAAVYEHEAPLPEDRPCDACGVPPGPSGCACDAEKE
jgi:hypothetical protein